MLIVIFTGAILYSHIGSSSHGQTGSTTYFTTRYATSFANSTFTFVSRQSVTADYVLTLNLNITCTGCAFTGEYLTSYQSASTPVSGNGSRSYSVGSFDSPLSLSWSVLKNSSAGMLTVRVTGPVGQTLYVESTSVPNGRLSGVWSTAVAYGAG